MRFDYTDVGLLKFPILSNIQLLCFGELSGTEVEYRSLMPAPRDLFRAVFRVEKALVDDFATIRNAAQSNCLSSPRDHNLLRAGDKEEECSARPWFPWPGTRTSRERTRCPPRFLRCRCRSRAAFFLFAQTSQGNPPKRMAAARTMLHPTQN